MTSTTIARPVAIGQTGLALSTEWLNPAVVRITAEGEVDASNVAALRDYVFRRAGNCESLILNLQNVTFFGTDGFSMLRTIDIRCKKAGVNWVVLPGAAVRRILDLCDREFEIPCGAV
jgi:anti-anti-sigma factor